MKKLIASQFTTDTIGFPPKSGTWDFLQLSYQECITAIMTQKVGFGYYSGTPYILFGLQKSIVGPNTVIASGALLFNEEIFLFGGTSFTTPVGPNVVICNIVITNYTDGTKADPVKYTDGNNHNVHNIRSVSFSSGTSGSGDVGDYDDFIHAYPEYRSSGPGGITFDVSPVVWSNLGSPYFDVAAKIEDDRILLCGAVQGTTPALGTFILFNINAGNFTIDKQSRVQCVIQTGSTYSNSTLTIATNGDVSVDIPTADDYVIYLDGVYFRIN